MDISRLQEFVTLASHLKLSSAARELFMSPSTLSQHISALEKELGCELFLRANGLALTRQGEAALEHAQSILFEYSGLLRDCADTAAAGTVRLSMPNYHFIKQPVIGARAAFAAAHPGCQVVITTNECQSSDPFASLDEGASDVTAIYIVRGCGYAVEDKLPPGISHIALPPQRCIFVSTWHHPLADKPTLSVGDLDGATVTLRLCPVCQILADSLTRTLNRHGALTRVLFRKATRNEDILMSNLGDAFMLWFEMLDRPDTGLPDLPIHRFEHELIADTYLLYRKDRLDRLQLAYLDAVRESQVDRKPLEDV